MLWYTGLLIFHAVTEPWNSGKLTKSHEIHKNTKNTAKFSRNLIKYMSVQHIWNLFQLLGLFTCHKLANLSSSLKRANNISKLPGVDYVAKNWALAIMLKALPLVTWDQALFSFRFENYIPAGKAKRKQTNFSGSRLIERMDENH